MPQVHHKQNWLLIYLIALTLFFILLEISFFIQASSLYLGVFKIVTYHLKIPTSVFPGIAYFLLMQLLIHIAYLFFIYILTLFVSQTFRLTQSQTEKTGILLWFIGISMILLANQIFYPNSKFAILTSTLFPPTIAIIFLIILTIFFSLAILSATYSYIKNKHRLLITSLLILFLSGISLKHHYNIRSAATFSKPNIILIGIDAVRPDFLGFFGSDNQTPHLDYFLNQSAVFSESLTPLARTYPAWISILTGQYPKKNGVRLDLAEHITFDVQETLPAILKKAGYQTLYATDETRFSNIDERFGFDQTITPPIGFNDFLLGSFNDFPLSNLVINTFLGRYLFPYSHANRAAYITYNPTTFLNDMESTLAKPHSKPLFLAVHFCLPHYPYLWAGRSGTTSPVENYRHALTEADSQLNGFLERLHKNKLLDHSIVVLLSDHGEALELPGDRITESDLFIPGSHPSIPHFYPPSEYHEKPNQSGGHGTDVLGLTQYHTLLAFKFTGTETQNAYIIPGRVSLLDIKPTLLELLKIPDTLSNGKSLLKAIRGEPTTITTQADFFTETDFTPEAIRSVNPQLNKVIFEGIDYIKINPHTTRLSIQQRTADLILSSKQYADFYGPWVLALYPQSQHWMLPVLVNLESGKWTTDLHTTFAKRAPTQHMLQALKQFYGSDLTQIELSN